MTFDEGPAGCRRTGTESRRARRCAGSAGEGWTSGRVAWIELRFFGGLSVEETATVLAVSPETVMRDWKLAKAWLMRELRGEG